MSTAEILFDDSEFALLPGQGAFVRAQVSVSDTEGPLEAGEEAGLVGERGGGGWGGGVRAGVRGHRGFSHGVRGAHKV